MTRARRSYLHQKITEGQSASEFISSIGSDPVPQPAMNVSESTVSESSSMDAPKWRTKTNSGLIYLGRLAECKKLKIWLRPVDSSILV
jgi:hypothetical protein